MQLQDNWLCMETLPIHSDHMQIKRKQIHIITMNSETIAPKEVQQSDWCGSVVEH